MDETSRETVKGGNSRWGYKRPLRGVGRKKTRLKFQFLTETKVKTPGNQRFIGNIET